MAAIIENRIDLNELISFEDGLYLAHKAVILARQDDKILGEAARSLSNEIFEKRLA